jgi:hypothetical protein|tara:strand:+ start:658 stop:921 length:264 start_codon:yes stop_codon:yes gene_type:complete
MGFHKRWINEEILIGNYRRQGIEGVRMLWGADAIITSDDLSHNVSDLVSSEELSEIDKWNKISELISDASIRKGFNEKKNQKTTITG